MNKKRFLCILLILTFVCALSLSAATAAKTVSKKTTVNMWELDRGTNEYTFIKINKGKTYRNGHVYGTNPMTMKKQKAPVYASKLKISALKNVKITKVVVASRGYPSGKISKKAYYFKKSKTIKPAKYKSFEKIKVYYKVKKKSKK